MEKIKILVQFDDTKVKPMLFVRAGRQYKIDKLTLVNHFREGDQRIFHFHIVSGGNYFQLRFEPETLRWFLVEN